MRKTKTKAYARGNNKAAHRIDPPGAAARLAESNRLTAKATADGGGLRYTEGKNQLELIPMEWIWGLGMVLTRGAAKYAPRNWERGMAWSRMIGSALRHIAKFAMGERYDPETGCHHLFMAGWNCCALASYDLRQIGDNDLPNQDTGLALLQGVAIAPEPKE